MEALISVVICTYNRKSLVARAVDSVLAQVGVDMEVIVVDDCSTDGTCEYLKDRYDGRIKVVRNQSNSGVATSTNKGVQSSSGRFIALLGDDDYWVDPKKIHMQVTAMKDSPNLGVAGTWWIELQKGGVSLEKKPTPPVDGYYLKEMMLMGGGVVCGSTPLVSREAWDAVGGMDEAHPRGTDSDLFRRISLSGFGVKVMPVVTAAVDISHTLSRMTPADNLMSVRSHMKSNFRVLMKHGLLWVVYPRAFFVRLRRVMYLSAKFLFFKLKGEV